MLVLKTLTVFVALASPALCQSIGEQLDLLAGDLSRIVYSFPLLGPIAAGLLDQSGRTLGQAGNSIGFDEGGVSNLLAGNFPYGILSNPADLIGKAIGRSLAGKSDNLASKIAGTENTPGFASLAQIPAGLSEAGSDTSLAFAIATEEANPMLKESSQDAARNPKSPFEAGLQAFKAIPTVARQLLALAKNYNKDLQTSNKISTGLLKQAIAKAQSGDFKGAIFDVARAGRQVPSGVGDANLRFFPDLVRTAYITAFREQIFPLLASIFPVLAPLAAESVITGYNLFIPGEYASAANLLKIVQALDTAAAKPSNQ